MKPFGKKFIASLKRVSHGRHYTDENLDMYYRMQFSKDEIE